MNNIFVFYILLLVFTLININNSYFKEDFKNKSKLKTRLAKSVLKKSIFNDKKCLNKNEMKEKVNEQIDKYYSMYSLFTGKEEVCMKDFENYIIDV